MSRGVKGQNVISGFFWSFGERITAQLITFVVTIILARLLTPGEYGVVALILGFITLANVFVSNGLGEALVQDKQANEKDFSSIFWCSFVLSAVLYAGIFFASPFIATFFKNDTICPLLRVIALKLPISSISTIQHAYVSKHMQFKKFFFSTLGGTLISGVVGVAMAYMGFGPWAVVVQYLVNSSVDTIVLLITVPWRPHLWFDKRSAKRLIAFGWKMMISAFINAAYGEIRSIVIGKVYSTEDLAQYKRGHQFPQLFITNINTAVSAVIFPAMAKVNDDIAEVKRLTRRAMVVTAYLIFPLMVGMAAVAEPLVKVLLTDKWLPCVNYLQLACISFGLQPIQEANCQAIKSIGRSDVYLKMEIIKKTIGIGLLFAVINKGVTTIAIIEVVSICISAVISVIPNKRLIGYSIFEQIKDLLPSLVMSAIMGLSVYPFTFLSCAPLVIVSVQFVVGVMVYLILSKLTKNEAFEYLLDIIQDIAQKRKNQGAVNKEE